MPRALRTVSLALLTLSLLASACAGQGSVLIFIAAEDTIPEGLEPGDGDEQIVDGWTVKYSKFLVTVGNFRAARSLAPDDEVRHDEIYVVDLTRLPPGGVVLAQLDGLEAARWDRFGYDLAAADDSAVAAEGTSQADRDLMVMHGWSHYIEGEMTKPDGQSCPAGAPDECVPQTRVTFRWGLAAATGFDDCASPEGDAGFAVPEGGTVQIKPTIHGDHWFFTNLTQGAEITERRAQWIADAQQDRDEETSLDELRATPADTLFTPALGYNPSGALIPIVTAYDFLAAQARTIADFQGEGECPTREVL